MGSSFGFFFFRACHSVTIGRNIVLLVHNGLSKKNISSENADKCKSKKTTITFVRSFSHN